MNINLILSIILILLIPIVAVSLLLLFGLAIRYFGLYAIRVKRSQDPSEYPEVTIPPEVTALINRFDPHIKIRVTDDRLVLAQATTFGKRPSYIIFSKQFLDQGTPEAKLFGVNDITAIVAHELGHIIPKSHAVWLLGIIFGGILITIMSISFIGLFLSLIIIIFLLYWAGFVSRDEEKRADSFAVVDAQIPAADYTQSLIKLYTYYSKQREATAKPWGFMASSIAPLLFNSHPDIEQRVNRIHILYGREFYNSMDERMA